jgi:hypothetical protein
MVAADAAASRVREVCIVVVLYALRSSVSPAVRVAGRPSVAAHPTMTMAGTPRHAPM